MANNSPVNWGKIYENIRAASNSLSSAERGLTRSKSAFTNAYQKAKNKKNAMSVQMAKLLSEKVKKNSVAVEQAKMALEEANGKLVLGKEKNRRAAIAHSIEAQKHGIQLGTYIPSLGGRRTLKRRLSRRRRI